LIRIRIRIQSAVSFGSGFKIKSNKITQKGAVNKLKRVYKGCDFACKATILFLRAVKVLLGSLRRHVQGVKDLEQDAREL
jgi:hypothetical protein